MGNVSLRNIKTLEEKHLKAKGKKILVLLRKDGEKFMSEDPEVFLEMVKKAHCLIASPLYLEIIQKMVEINERIKRGPPDGALQCLVQQMEEMEKMWVLCKHQEKLLSLTQMLLNEGDLSQTRTRCLRALLLRTDYTGQAGLKWMGQLVATVGLLLEGGADPTWIPQDISSRDGSALYYFLQELPLILAHNNHLYDELMTLLPKFLTEQCLNHREPKGTLPPASRLAGEETVLHALVKADWKWLPEDLPEDFSERYGGLVRKVVEANCALLDMTDSDGRNPLQCLISRIAKHKDLLRIINHIIPALTTENSVKAQDNHGQTVLHILARAALEQDLGNGLLNIFLLLTTKRNVNLSDKDSTTPLSWILIAKERWENKENDGKIYSEIQNILVSERACADRAKCGLLKSMYTWAAEQLSNRWTCTLERLQKLLSAMNTMIDWSTQPNEKCLSYMEEFDEAVWDNLRDMRNAKFISTALAIMRILITNESTAQYAWNSMTKNLLKYSGNHIVTLSSIEILCLCAEKGAQPTDEELKKLLSMTTVMIRSEELTVAFLRTLVVLQKNKHFTCDLQFLGEFYIVSEDMLQIGKLVAKAVYKTMDSCLQSGKLINCLLFISHEQDAMLQERFIDDSFSKNWLLRSPLHLAAIFLNTENSLKCIPHNIVTKYIHARDLHGCTPLHLAYLHHNTQAVQFLVSNGAMGDVRDNFGMSPESLGSSDTTADNPDVKYKELCCSVLKAKCGVLKIMRSMLVHSEAAAKALSEEVKTLLERLVEGTKFESARVVICGSMRERLKAGCLDEADVQLRFEGKHVSVTEFSIAGVKWFKRSFFPELLGTLKKRLTEISWEGIDLRPVSVHGPWKFLREGMTVSLDVVVVWVYKGKTQMKAYGPQKELLRGNFPLHRKMEFCPVTAQNTKSLKPTFFAYEWDTIDSLPTSCRLAIVIAKALVQAYDLVSGDNSRVKMPVTSYTIKTALFYILAYNCCSDLEIEDSGIHFRLAEAVRNALKSVAGDKAEVASRPKKLKYNPKPAWPTDEDADQHAEEASVWGRKIFTFIKCLTQQRHSDSPHGWQLNSYWTRYYPVNLIAGCGEAESICDVCDFALDRLNPNTFLTNDQ